MPRTQRPIQALLDLLRLSAKGCDHHGQQAGEFGELWSPYLFPDAATAAVVDFHALP